MAVCLNTGGVVVVIDVDPRNGGDIEKVRQLLAELKVRVFAAIRTLSGGKHFYVSGHPSLPTVHSELPNPDKPDKLPKLPNFPGVDIQSFGANVFLPGTLRPKWDGRGTRSSLTTWTHCLMKVIPLGQRLFRCGWASSWRCV